MGLWRPIRENMVKRRKTIVVLLGVMFLCALSLIPARNIMAQEKVIELRYASPYPPTHTMAMADQKWIAKIEAETKGRVKIKPYWSGTLVSGRESMQELKKGVADIAHITPIYEKSGVDLTKVIVDFFSDANDEVKAKVYWELYNKYPEIRKEYEAVKILCLGGNTGELHLMTIKKPVKTIEDMKGMRLRVTGEVLMRTLKALGTEPVSMPVPEMYESLQKGIIQGVLFGDADYKALKLSEIIKYDTNNFLVYVGPFPVRAMNLDTWKKLPPDIQKIFDANAGWCMKPFRMTKKPQEEGKAAALKAGVQFVNDQAGLQKYESIFDAENMKEAQALDAKGYPGTKIYNEARRLIKQYNTAK